MNLNDNFTENPFILEPKDNLQEVFVERDCFSSVLDIFRNSIISPLRSEAKNWLISGYPGTGKTATLKYISTAFPDNITPIWLTELPSTENKIKTLLINKTFSHIQLNRVSVEDSAWKQIGDELKRAKKSKDIYAFMDICSGSASIASGKQIMFLVDETSAVRYSKIHSLLCNLLFKVNISFVFSMLPQYYHLIKDNPLRDRFDYVTILPPLNKTELIQMIKKRVHIFANELGGLPDNYPLTEEALDLVLDITKGNPRDALKLMREAVSPAVHSEYITPKHIEPLIPTVLPEQYHQPFEAALLPLTHLQKQLCKTIKKYQDNLSDQDNLPDRDNHPDGITQNQLVKLLNKPQPLISTYLNDLIDEGYVVKKTIQRKNYYTISQDSLGYLQPPG